MCSAPQPLLPGNYDNAQPLSWRMAPALPSPHPPPSAPEVDPDERRNGIELRHGSRLSPRVRILTQQQTRCAFCPAASSARPWPVPCPWSLAAARKPRRHLRVPRGGPRRSVLRGAGRGQRGGCCHPEPAQEGPHRRLICHLLPPLETSSYSTRPPGIRGPCVVSVDLFTQKRLPGVENRSSRFALIRYYLPCFTRWISPRS